MSLFKRIGDLIRSNVNDALDQVEDPRKMLEQSILDMQEQHQKARKTLVETMALLKQTEKQAETQKAQGVEWEQKAMAALKAGREDLARQALAEKQKAETMAQETLTGVDQQKVQVETVKKQITELENKIEDAKRRKDVLIGQLNAAEAKKRAADMQTGASPDTSALSDGSAFGTFDRMASKITQSESEAEAHHELIASQLETAKTEAEFKKQMEKQSAEDMLSALKAKMQGGASSTASTATTAAPAAPAADPAVNAIDDELAKLRAKLGG